MIKYVKYLNPLVLYILAALAYLYTGLYCWLVPIYAYVLVPLLELTLPVNEHNMTAAEEELAKKDVWYDYMLYIIVLLQFPTILYFLYSFTHTSISTIDVAGRIFTMGILCGTFGINVGHELGHRKGKGEQLLAKVSLLSSLYMHFFIEHNKGHHKHVATPQDPSSARYSEVLYLFWLRTITYSYLDAWRIANDDVVKKGHNKWSIHNEMLQAQVIQIALLLVIYISFGALILLYFVLAAIIGILMLETVNYIEHYGLQRKLTSATSYERTMPQHSWNSNHPLGRVLLFELSRHSDHHYLASRPYQILRHHQNAPQLPTGYPGSMLLAMVPPLWFYIMHKRIALLQQ